MIDVWTTAALVAAAFAVGFLVGAYAMAHYASPQLETAAALAEQGRGAIEHANRTHVRRTKLRRAKAPKRFKNAPPIDERPYRFKASRRSRK